MGISDRDYYRKESSGLRLQAPRSAVGAIILLNVAVFVLEIFSGSTVVNLLSTHVGAYDTLWRPWMWWQFLTYGFVHDPNSAKHIVFNMLTLFFLGRDVEKQYGTREFIRLYLMMLAFAAVVWTVTTQLFQPHEVANMIDPRTIDLKMFGASGAIAGVVVLYALNFPKRIMLFMFVLPMPAWLMGAIFVAIDIFGATFPERGTMLGIDPRTAFTAHLGGAAFALAYFNLHWNFGQLFGAAAAWLKGLSRPSLKVFKPEDESGPDVPVADEDVDHILEKIHREGENSLTRKERRILENASREYQRRRHPE